MVEVLTAEDVQRLGMSPEMIGMGYGGPLSMGRLV